MHLILLSLCVIVTVVLFFQFSGTPSRFQLKRSFDLAAFLGASIQRAKQDSIIDEFGNLDIVARNSWFLTYRGFYQSDVEKITSVIAKKSGFQRAYVDFDSGVTIFRFKRLVS